MARCDRCEMQRVFGTRIDAQLARVARVRMHDHRLFAAVE
jgi:hypothetical protein